MNQFKIELKNPCNQDWNALPQVHGGLYCSQCTKVITDFTKMSDEELIRVLSKKRTGEICGKFYQSQLEKVYVLQNYKPERSYLSLKLLLAGLLTLRLSSEAQTSSVQKPTIIKTGQEKPVKKPHTFVRSIKGKVTNRETRAGITVAVNLYADRSNEDLISTVFTDSLGHYEIVLPDSGIHKFFKLVFTSEKFNERTVVVDRDKIPQYLPVGLQPMLTVEIVSFITRNINDYQTTGGIPEGHYRYEHEHEYGGTSPQIIQTIKLPLHKRIWARIKFACRKTFRKTN